MPKKLRDRWTGPHLVQAKDPAVPNHYLVHIVKKNGRLATKSVHVNRLHLYRFQALPNWRCPTMTNCRLRTS